jgi:hypothetical protein
VFWQLAFWEWIGAVVAFAFLIGSVRLLPASCGDRRQRLDPASALAMSRMFFPAVTGYPNWNNRNNWFLLVAGR